MLAVWGLAGFIFFLWNGVRGETSKITLLFFPGKWPLSRCLGPGERLHSFIQMATVLLNNNNKKKNKRPLTPKSMPPAGDEHAKLNY